MRTYIRTATTYGLVHRNWDQLRMITKEVWIPPVSICVRSMPICYQPAIIYIQLWITGYNLRWWVHCNQPEVSVWTQSAPICERFANICIHLQMSWYNLWPTADDYIGITTDCWCMLACHLHPLLPSSDVWVQSVTNCGWVHRNRD